MKNNKKILTSIVFLMIVFVITYISNNISYNNKNNLNDDIVNISTESNNISIDEIPEYNDKSYVEINNNKPYFKENEYKAEAFENYSKLDDKGRCGVAYANICKEIMPSKSEERVSISSVYPTGWKQKKINGEFVYNRCHLIGYQLAGENANELNLITGTRYFNVTGMLPFENEVAEYMEKNINNHVLYRVTPLFKGDNLLASGVEMEAFSVEDNGQGVCFNVFVYNVQPGVSIDYSTGKLSYNK